MVNIKIRYFDKRHEKQRQLQREKRKNDNYRKLCKERTALWRVKNGTQKVCKVCGKSFLAKYYPHKVVKACSKQCGYKIRQIKDIYSWINKCSKSKKGKLPKNINQFIEMGKQYRFGKHRKPNKVSKAQIALYDRIKQIYPDALLNEPIHTNNTTYFADTFIPSLKIDFEYDCSYWHDLNGRERDTIRDNDMELLGIRTVRVEDLTINKINRLNVKDLIK